MILLAILSIIFGVFKLFILSRINWDNLLEEITDQLIIIDPEIACNITKTIILTDGLVSILCGIYILLI